jgi:hypothetical protein
MDARAWHIISGSLYQAQHAYANPLCDYVLHRSPARGAVPLHAILAELKSRGSIRAKHIRDQLQGGVTLIEQKVATVVDGVECLLVVDGISNPEIAALARLTVSWRGTKIPIRIRKSGTVL